MHNVMHMEEYVHVHKAQCTWDTSCRCRRCFLEPFPLYSQSFICFYRWSFPLVRNHSEKFPSADKPFTWPSQNIKRKITIITIIILRRITTSTIIITTIIITTIIITPIIITTIITKCKEMSLGISSTGIRWGRQCQSQPKTIARSTVEFFSNSTLVYFTLVYYFSRLLQCAAVM